MADNKRVLKDGERLRVPVQFMDSLQRDVAGTPNGLYPLGGTSKERQDESQAAGHAGTIIGEDAMPQDRKTVVLDGRGRLAGSRPGHCYLHSGGGTTDHAAQVTREFNRQEAYADVIREMCDAWRGTNRDLYEVPRVHHTGDAMRDAYLDAVSDLENAWHRGKW